MAKKPIRRNSNFQDETDSRLWQEELAKFLSVGNWYTPSLLGTWTVAGGRTVQYSITPFGDVSVVGAVTGGTGDIFTLPDGYRPHQDSYFCCYQGGAAEVRVNTNGVVSLTTPGTGGLSLDPISFRV